MHHNLSLSSLLSHLTVIRTLLERKVREESGEKETKNERKKHGEKDKIGVFYINEEKEKKSWEKEMLISLKRSEVGWNRGYLIKPGCIVVEVGMLLVCLSDNRVDLVVVERNYSYPLTCSSYVRSHMCILFHHWVNVS